MSEVVTAAPAPPVVRLPPAVRGPKLFQGLAFVVSRRRLLGRFVRRYGKAFTANILMYGRVVVVADPQLARQVFTSSPEELGNIQPNLSRMLVLRTVLRHFTLETTTAAGERSHGRGVAFTPKDGGRVVMRRR